MITRFGLVQKREDMTLEQFNKHWQEKHGPIVAGMDSIRHYRQNLVTNATQLGIGFSTRSPITVDGFSELCWDNAHDMNKGIASQAEAAQADLKLFTKQSQILVTLKRKVIPFRENYPHPLIKRMTLLKRNPEMSSERFDWEWLGLHGEMVKFMPNVVAYHQNVILDRIIDGKSVSYDEMPYDGIVEMWFESVEQLEECFASANYKYTSFHGKDFLDTMTTFLVEETSIV